PGFPSPPSSSGTQSSRCETTESVPSATLHEQPDSGALLAVDRDVDHRRDAYEGEAAWRDVPARDGDGLDGLVDRAGADCLDFDASLAADHARYCAGDGDRLRGGRNLEH